MYNKIESPSVYLCSFLVKGLLIGYKEVLVVQLHTLHPLQTFSAVRSPTASAMASLSASDQSMMMPCKVSPTLNSRWLSLTVWNIFLKIIPSVFPSSLSMLGKPQSVCICINGNALLILLVLTLTLLLTYHTHTYQHYSISICLNLNTHTGMKCSQR